MSLSSQAALSHLRVIKPKDGWTVKKNDTGLKLYRRNVALTDNSFLDIHYDSKQNLVVGVLTANGKICQVLVDQKGRPVSLRKIVSCHDTYDPNNVSRTVNFQRSRATAATRTATEGSQPTLTPEQNQEIVKYALYGLGICIILKMLASSFLLLYFLCGPLTFLYALQTCPTVESFDAKKELKRVLRGHHLPENHPEKPKGYFEQMAYRFAASVATELATLPGYEVTISPLFGAAIWINLYVPTANTQHFWIGAFGKWFYIHSRERVEV